MALRRTSLPGTLLALSLVTALLLAACSSSGSESEESADLTVYSGRTENLVGPILAEFTKETGIDVEVRYGQSADLALQIEQEGDRSPADVFISQSPGAVGYLADQGALAVIDSGTLQRVQPDFRNADGQWVGMSGRVRVLVYNTDDVDPKSLPASVFDLTAEEYRGKVGLAPSNGSFQDFVTGMRVQFSDERAEQWLRGMADIDSPTYANNTAIVEAVGRGEIPMGLVNHYYNERAKAEVPDVPSENYFFPDGDIGSLLITTAVGILRSSDSSTQAQRLAEFLLGDQAQEFFSQETFEYPLAKGVPAPHDVPPLDSLDYATLDIDALGGGLPRTLELIERSGLQ